MHVENQQSTTDIKLSLGHLPKGVYRILVSEQDFRTSQNLMVK